MNDREHDDDGVEELDDDVIIAQETAAHAPAPRARVSTDHPSIVIASDVGQWGPGPTDVPGVPRKLPTVPPMRRADRTEKTVVIRDRKSLDRLRREASRPPRSRSRGSKMRTLYLIGVAVLASLAAGTLLATLANSNSEQEPSVVIPAEEQPSVVPSASRSGPEVVDLEDLPVVKKKRKKRPVNE